MSKWFRFIVFAGLTALLVGLSAVNVQSSALPADGIATRAASAAPARQGGSGPYIYYFPLVARSQDLWISRVRVIQGSTPDNYAAYIANRPTVVRAFVGANGGTISGVHGRIYGFNVTGTSLGSVDSNTITAPSLEGDMNRTLNFTLPPNWLNPGTSYYIRVDPDNTIAEDNESNNRYPSSDTVSFNFVAARPVDIVVVPIMYLPWGAAYSTQPYLGNLDYIEWMPKEVLPVPSVTYTLHPMVNYIPNPTAYPPTHDLYNPSNPGDASGWMDLLNQITTLHNQEDPGGTKIYYGVVNIADAFPGYSDYYTGMGWLNAPTATGWSGGPNGDSRASATISHEMGHIFGREHVLCRGDEDNPDHNYPYTNGSIGTYGLDVTTGQLLVPGVYADYMSYCTNVWTSDYTYAGIKQFRDSTAYAAVRASSSIPVPALYVSGSIAPNGTVTLRPLYEQNAPVDASSQGTHTLELLDTKGATLASYGFTPARVPDSKGFTGFGFFVPTAPGLTGLRIKTDGKTLAEKSVSALPSDTNFARQPQAQQSLVQGNTLRWAAVTHPSASVVYRIRVSRDKGATWQVLALDWRTTEFTLPPGVDLTGALVEIQASDGIHTVTRTFTP